MKVDPTERAAPAEEAAEPEIPAAILTPQSAEPNFLRRGRMQFRQTLKEAANYRELRKTPYGLKPVIVFTILFAVLTLDGAILGNAIPEISRSLDVTLAEVIRILSIIGFFLIFLSLGLAYLADRVRRVTIVGIGSIINGFASLFTTRVTAGPQAAGHFAAIRGLDGLGQTALGTPIFSLQADYYPPETRGKVFALFGVLGRVVALAAPLFVAVLATATALEWRLPYFITGALTLVAGVIVLIFLREPIRGYMERRALGAPEEVARVPEEPPSFGEAWRTIWGIKTLRRLFIAEIPGFAGSYVFSIIIAGFLFQEYRMTLMDRAVLSTALIAFALPFGFMAGGIVDVLIRRRPQRVLVFSGLLAVVSSLFLAVMASTPPFWLLVVGFMSFGAAGALLGPAGGVLRAQILPAHIRTLGGAVFSLAAIPGTLIVFYTISQVLFRWGPAGALFMAFPFILVSAFIQLSAAGLFERDMRAALASQIASKEWRKAKEAGKGKMLVCRDVDVEYDGVQVLFGVDFDVEEGEIIALLGTNGAGKSTLLKAISGVEQASSGAVVFDGRDITRMPPYEIAGRGVIHMPGGRGVFPGLTVKENILMGTWIADPSEIKQRLDEIYRVFPVLKERQNVQAGMLSGGEQQMVSLAQAFLAKPRLLMIDELSLGLSPAVVQELIEVVKRINEAGVTIILVEQSVNVALTVAQRCVFMEKGEIKFFGDTKELLRRPDILRAVYVKGTGSLTEGAPAGALKSERELRQYEILQARAILDVKEVTKAYGGIRAVDSVSFELREGELLGIIGPNGAGKSTLFDMISGYQPADSGRIIFDGVDVTNMRADERANRRLVRRFQDARLFPSLTVFENILVSLDRKLEVRNMFFTALQLPQVRQSERRVRLRAERLIELLELGAYRDKFVKELSTGLRRITDLACVLAAEPKVLLLDEPSSGIAQAEAEGLAPLLRRVRFETGCSMLVIEHDMPLVASIADELIAMHEGRILVRGAPDEVLNDERVIESYLGTSEESVKRSGLR